MLSRADFPEHFVDMHHPDDYNFFDSPIERHLIDHFRSNPRLLCRISFKVNAPGSCNLKSASQYCLRDAYKFVPMTFIVDTGSTNFVSLSMRAIAILSRHERLEEDDFGTKFIRTFFGGRRRVINIVDTEQRFEPANLIGLPLIRMLGLTYNATDAFFQADLPFL